MCTFLLGELRCWQLEWFDSHPRWRHLLSSLELQLPWAILYVSTSQIALTPSAALLASWTPWGNYITTYGGCLLLKPKLSPRWYHLIHSCFKSLTPDFCPRQLRRTLNDAAGIFHETRSAALPLLDQQKAFTGNKQSSFACLIGPNILALIPLPTHKWLSASFAAQLEKTLLCCLLKFFSQTAFSCFWF